MRARRAGRASALLPIDGQAPRDADELLAPAVEETIEALQLGESDAAAAQLVRRYAAVIDEARDPAWAMRWLAPLLMDALAALQATPATRPAAKPPAAPNRLDQLRAARATTKRGR